MRENKRRQKETKRKWHIDYIDMSVDSVAAIKKLQKRILNEGGFTREMYKILYDKVYSTYNVVLIDFYNWTIKPFLQKSKERTIVPQKTRNELVLNRQKNTEAFPGKSFIMKNGCVKIGKYIMKTNYAYDLPDGMMKQVQGIYTIHKLVDGTFYFGTGQFGVMRKEIERLCHIHIGNKLKKWEKEELVYISSYIRNKVSVYISMILSPDLSKYDVKTDSYPLIVDYQQLPKFERQLPYRNYPDFINQIKEIPVEYRKSYLVKHPQWSLLERINEQFKEGLMNLINSEFSYTAADRELDEMEGKLGIPFTLMSVNNCSIESARYISIPAAETNKLLQLTCKRHPGKLFKFSKEGIESISQIVNILSLENNGSLPNILDMKSQLIKGKYIKYESQDLYGGCYYLTNLLYDIKDNRYEKSHPKCWHLFNSGTPERCRHILYFKDPNLMCSHDSYTPIRCYMICMDRHIRLFELDSTKSTYAFTIREGMMEPAIFLLWSYFSSYLVNKRQDKELLIEHLFDAFGIKYWFRENPISKFDDGDYFFDQETNSLI